MSNIQWYIQFDGITEIGVKNIPGIAYGFATIQKLDDRYRWRVTIEKHHRYWPDDAKGSGKLKWSSGWTEWKFSSSKEDAKSIIENYIWEFIDAQCGRYIPEYKQTCCHKKDNVKRK